MYNVINCLSFESEYEEIVGYNDIGMTYDYKKKKNTDGFYKNEKTVTNKKPVNGKYDLIRVIGTV